MELPALKKDDVIERLSFANRRLQDLNQLNDGDLARADGSIRQQLIQEFFFHLVGSIDLVAQFINEVRELEIKSEDVRVKTISNKLELSDDVKPIIDSLYQSTRQPFPSDPYHDESYIYRIYNYRNQVTHRRRNHLFIFEYFVSVEATLPESALMLDPRDANLGPANRSAIDELDYMYRLIERRCLKILEILLAT